MTEIGGVVGEGFGGRVGAVGGVGDCLRWVAGSLQGGLEVGEACWGVPGAWA